MPEAKRAAFKNCLRPAVAPLVFFAGTGLYARVDRVSGHVSQATHILDLLSKTSLSVAGCLVVFGLGRPIVMRAVSLIGK
jgi:hypothetical protein